jgi:hypothetical protein
MLMGEVWSAWGKRSGWIKQESLKNMFESRPQLEGNREGLDGDGRNMQRMIYES